MKIKPWKIWGGVTLLLTLLALIGGLVTIWSGDERWGESAALFIVPICICAVATLATWSTN